MKDNNSLKYSDFRKYFIIGSFVHTSVSVNVCVCLSVREILKYTSLCYELTERNVYRVSVTMCFQFVTKLIYDTLTVELNCNAAFFM